MGEESTDQETAAAQPMKGKKRKRKPEEWKKNVRKQLRNTGKEYISSRGKKVRERKIGNIPCGCRRHCDINIPHTQRELLFNGFYELADWGAQNAFIIGSVKVTVPKRRYVKDRVSRKQFSRTFYLKNADGDNVQVCKAFFMKTLDISNCRLNRAIVKSAASGTPVVDRRGKHEPANKTAVQKMEHVKKFIESFPTYRSHYSRRENPRRKYFSPGLNITKLYKLFKETCNDENIEPVSMSVFRNVFLKEYNIAFHAPHTDTCKTCDTLEASIKSANSHDGSNFGNLNELKRKKELHLRLAESAQNKYKTDKDRAVAKDGVTVFSFDLMKTLPVPVLSTSIVYYKRQMWTYVMGVHDAGSNIPYMYTWDESIGSRGPNEVASCVLKHIQLKRTTKHIIAYSDACGGQNRNIKMCLFWLHVVNNPEYEVEIVDHKFFVSGHSFMDSDKDFGIIEKSKRFQQQIYVPSDWSEAIANVRDKNPFIVTQLKPTDLRSTHLLQKRITNRKTSKSGCKVEWFKIVWLRFERGKDFEIQYKTTHQDDYPFESIDIKKRGKGKLSTLGKIELPILYLNGHPIGTAKLKDLQDLLCFVPPVYHEFYKGLKGDDVLEDLIPIDDNLSDESETS